VDHINADPKGTWYRLVRQKIDQEFVHGLERIKKKTNYMLLNALLHI
jgi:mannose/cellobiose epimerase-like protein (N-acyl-D-glucosamine 2-epimerase family)